MTRVCRLHEEVIGTSLLCSEERDQGSAALLEALIICWFCCCFFKHEKSQGGVREAIQPRQNQALGLSVLILLPQNPVQIRAMDSMDFIVLGDGCDGECLMFSYYWCITVLQVLLSSRIHCFSYFHQWLTKNSGGFPTSFTGYPCAVRGTWKVAVKRNLRELLPCFVQLRPCDIKAICFLSVLSTPLSKMLAQPVQWEERVHGRELGCCDHEGGSQAGWRRSSILEKQHFLPRSFSFTAVKFWPGFSSQIHQALRHWWQHSVLRVGRTVVRNASPNLSELKTVFADSVGQEVLGWSRRKEEESMVSWLFPDW